MRNISLLSGTSLALSGGGSVPLNFTTTNIYPRFVVFDSIMTESSATVDTDLVFNVCRKYPFGYSEVDYAITAGTAVLNTDYSAGADALTGTLSFSDGDMYKTISVRTLTGGGAGNRTVTCTLSNAVAADIDDATATGTIQEGTVTGYPDGTAIATIVTALEAASPGDAVMLERGGTYGVGTSLAEIDRAVGTAANPIILGAYGTGEIPDIRETAFWFRGANASLCSEYVNMQDIRCLRVQATNGPTNKDVNNFNFLRLSCIDGGACQTTEKQGDILFECCRHIRCENHGIIGQTIAMTVRYCYFDTCYNPELLDNGWSTYVGLGCVVEYCWYECRDISQGIKHKNCVTGILRGNVIKDAALVGMNVGPTAAHVNDITLDSNVLLECSIPAQVVEQTGAADATGSFALTAYNNVFVGAGRELDNQPIIKYDNTGEAWVAAAQKWFNNTFILSRATTMAMWINYDATYTGSEWRNNLVYGDILPHTGVNIIYWLSTTVHGDWTISNNLYPADVTVLHKILSTTYADLAAYNVAFPSGEANSVEDDDPSLADVSNNDWHIASGSSAEDAGFDTTGTVATDIEGNTRTVPVDIGAFKV